MKTLTEVELNAVTGADGGIIIVLTVVGMVGAVAAFAYEVGKEMAERDNNLSCPAPSGP